MILRACVLSGALPSQAVVIGDSDFDRRAAAAAATRFIGLRTEGDATLERLADLPELLEI
jgi:phosphoglycolate phosphatase/AHBA synthesis associated protein